MCVCGNLTHKCPLTGRATKTTATVALKGLGRTSFREERKPSLPEEARLGSAPVSHGGGDMPSPGSHFFRVYCVRVAARDQVL